MRQKGGAWVPEVRPEPEATSRPDTLQVQAEICPMSGAGLNETDIAAELYPSTQVDPSVGRYRRNMVGHVKEGDFRARGSSGGMLSWLLVEMLERGEIDAVIHVRPSANREDDLLFEYAISATGDEICKGAKSRYYPIEMSGMLKVLNKSDKTFAFVGLPCFIKAIRLLQFKGLIREGAVRSCIGLICGHLKTKYFGEYLAWQSGVSAGDVDTLDFRHKLDDRPASQYGFAVKAKGQDRPVVRPMSTLTGGDWGEGLFKNPACEFCDDVIAECADIVVGDAWLPGYVNDPAGTNVLVIRDQSAEKMVQAAIDDDRLELKDVSAKVLALSQSSGLRHRREGLSHRLARRVEQGTWLPRKRVHPAFAETGKRRLIYDLRQKIALESSRQFDLAKAAEDLTLFEQAITPLLQDYRRAMRKNPVARIAKKIWSVSKQMLSQR